jgi:hypothetical protein
MYTQSIQRNPKRKPETTQQQQETQTNNPTQKEYKENPKQPNPTS